MTDSFNPSEYKRVTRDQWDASGAGYDAWGTTIRSLIQPAVENMMDTMGLSAGDSVLELACGPGEFTILLAERVESGGRVLATDLSPGMVELTKIRAEGSSLTQVEAREMDGEVIDVGDERFDAVASSLGLMFFPDPGASLGAQAAATKAGGHVGAVVIGGPAANPFFSVPAQIIGSRAGIAPPAPGMPGPFALGAPGLIESLFEGAGLSEVTAQPISSNVRLESVDEHLRFLKDAFGALHMMMSAMSEEEKADTWGTVAEALTTYQGPGGFESPAELIVCTGTVG